MVRNFAAFLILIWTNRHFAPTYFKLLPGLNSGSDFLLLAKFLNVEPWNDFIFLSYSFNSPHADIQLSQYNQLVSNS